MLATLGEMQKHIFKNFFFGLAWLSHFMPEPLNSCCLVLSLGSQEAQRSAQLRQVSSEAAGAGALG